MEDDDRVRRPAPVLTSDNEFFWRAAAERRLVSQACASCGRLRHPPRPRCPHCGSPDWSEAPLSGRGTVYSASILHHPQNPQFTYPVVAALIDLDEGVRIVSNVVDLDPHAVRIGDRVTVHFEPTRDDMALPVFVAIPVEPGP